MQIVVNDRMIEEVLSAWRVALGRAEALYRGHVYRVLNVTRSLLGTAAHDQTLAVASVFHDRGIWSDKTFDYLGPSIVRAREHVRTCMAGLDVHTVADVIDDHHRLRAVRWGQRREVADAFRRADLVDVSGGLLRAGVDRGFLRELTVAFPYADFHLLLVRTALAWFCRHPLRPLPMLRF